MRNPRDASRGGARVTGAPPLVLVAHGSRDPHSAATIRRLAAAMRTVADTDVRASFLDLSEPSTGEVLAALHDEGHRHVVAVPLLLGSAYHARVDLPELVTQTTARLPRLAVSVTDVLGCDPLLEATALDRLRESGAALDDPELGVVLAAVGSSHQRANTAVATLARRWSSRFACSVTPAFATAARPDVPSALAALRARGARRFAVASWFLAPGLLLNQVHRVAGDAAPDVRVAPPLGADPRVARVILNRYATAAELPIAC